MINDGYLSYEQQIAFFLYCDAEERIRRQFTGYWKWVDYEKMDMDNEVTHIFQHGIFEGKRVRVTISVVDVPGEVDHADSNTPVG